MGETKISKRLRLMARVRSATGMRVSELVRLEWSDVDLKENVVTIRSIKHFGYERNFPFNSIARAAFIEALDLGPPISVLVFPHPDRFGKAFTPGAVSSWFSRNHVITRAEWKKRWQDALKKGKVDYHSPLLELIWPRLN